jgi:hypothetical protein
MDKLSYLKDDDIVYIREIKQDSRTDSNMGEKDGVSSS